MAELFGFKFERIKDDKGSEKFTAPSRLMMALLI